MQAELSCACQSPGNLACAGNMVGALMLVGIAAVAGVFYDAPSGAMYYATYKTSHSFLEVRAAPDQQLSCSDESIGPHGAKS